MPGSGYPKVFSQTCAKCHVENPIGPKIPFDNPDQLGDWIKTKNLGARIQYRVFQAPEAHSMPPIRYLKESEKLEIQNYLKQF